MYLDGYILGVYLAGRFNLSSNYFANALNKKHNLNIEMKKINGFVFVKPPKEVRPYIEDDYISCKIEDNDKAQYDYIYKLSNYCNIGFWK